MIRRSTAIVFGLFVLLLASTLVWQKWGTKFTGAEATATISEDRLIVLDEPSVQAITLQDRDNRTVRLQRSDEGNWTLLYPAAEASDESAITTAVQQLLNVRIISRPQEMNDLATVGLAPAAFTILIETKDGKQVLINIGNQTPTAGGYYVLTGDRVIYVVNKFGIDGLIKFLDSPPALFTPTPSTTSSDEPALFPDLQILTPEPTTAP